MINEIEKAIRFKAKLRGGECCIGAQIGLTDPAVAEIFGRAGFDWMVVDTEHAPNTIETVRRMLQAAAATPAVLLARPRELDLDEIRRFLDIGSPGVLCPFINNGAEATRLVEFCRYPPAGVRGWGPRRAVMYGFDADEYLAKANDAMLCIPIIESPDAVEHIDEIVSVEGIEAISVGPMDLSMSLGCFKKFDHPLFTSAFETVRAACKRHGKVMGTGCYSLEHAKACASQGDGLLLVAGDDGYLASESRRCLGEVRASVPGKTA
jgi:2-keto-3-deoxy-L-rhamnonate aldolase RhmA